MNHANSSIIPSLQAQLRLLEQTQKWDQPLPQPLADLLLNQLSAVLESHLEQTSFGVDDLAKTFGISRMSLHRQLKSLVHQAPGAFIRSYRLQRARDYLRAGYRSAETAYRVGFESPSYFSQYFRAVYGMSPSRFARLTEKKADEG